MAVTHSPEQLPIFELRNGAYIVVANAGTGKTYCTSELFIRRYLDEERAIFGPVTDHVTGAKQLRILAQFMVVTFTVNAAAELDERIKGLFQEHGVPLPLRHDGKPYRIARTLDSLIQSWLRHPRVFEAWMNTDRDVQTRILDVFPLMPEGTRRALGIAGGRSDAWLFAKKWKWIAGQDVADMLLDLCLRHEEGAGIPGCDVDQWAAAFNGHLQSAALDEHGMIANGFWEQPLAVWGRYNDDLSSLAHAIRRGEAQRYSTGDREDLVARVNAWEKFAQMRLEFSAVQELARARGYHPVYAPEKLTARAIEEQLAAGEHLQSYRRFLSVSQRWHRLKTFFLLREFGDQTTAFVRACETYSELLERGKEYPGIVRRKYVVWDEVQDNSDFQHRILRLFYGKSVPYLSVAVGDPKQQIYCWRGASPRGFLDMIERKRRKEPDHVLGLTCSFRSAKRIVALGNEIVQTLPSYRDRVKPSTTIFQNDGHIEVSKPLVTVQEEAEWAADHIEYRLEKTTDSIMVLSRTEFSEHPLYSRYRSHPELGKRLSFLTIHRAKGLQADVVIALGLVAGRMPDYRSNSDEEANLFYVLCTRARHTLLLSGLMAKQSVNEAGKVEEKVVGPSPYFSRVATLKALCKASGWTAELLTSGIETHNQKLAVHLSRIDEQRRSLIRERAQLFPEVELKADAHFHADYGASDPSPALVAMPKRELDGADAPRTATVMVSERLRERVFSKLSKAYALLPDRVPRLTSDEFTAAVRSGWIERSATSKCFSFTSAFALRASVLESRV